MCKVKSDPDFLIETVDRIHNSVWSAVQEMAHNAEDLEWDMSIIGDISDYIEEKLKAHNIRTCYPFRLDDETICCAALDRCAYCPREKIGGVLDPELLDTCGNT